MLEHKTTQPSREYAWPVDAIQYGVSFNKSLLSCILGKREITKHGIGIADRHILKAQYNGVEGLKIAMLGQCKLLCEVRHGRKHRHCLQWTV